MNNMECLETFADVKIFENGKMRIKPTSATLNKWAPLAQLILEMLDEAGIQSGVEAYFLLDGMCRTIADQLELPEMVKGLPQ
jgi:hypothetical protein